MTAGRPRKPDALHIAHGTYQPCRHDDGGDSVKFRADGEPECPDYLSGSAGELWAMIVPELVSVGVATFADTWALIAMCEAWGDYRDLTEAAKEVEPNDATYHRIKRSARGSLHDFESFASKFGLTPSDRAKLRIPKQEDKSDGKGRFFA